ncbi:MAG: spore germination protein [Erysipelotrichia bacterium]|nr:spore germination protein [Erysipelotrichia bacterium]NCC55004.1 spore germination protein [Erysipelotrichia bacterium]
MKLSQNYDENINVLSKRLDVSANFDIVCRELMVSEYRCSFFFVDAFIKDEIIEKIMEFLLKEDCVKAIQSKDSAYFEKRLIPYVEVEVNDCVEQLVDQVLSGPMVLLVEGFKKAIVIDARTYPLRSVEEPKDDRVLRGSRDGFVETLVFNMALIRRRIRDPHLKVELMQVGKLSKSDLVVVYMDHKVDHEVLRKIKEKINKIDVEALTMAQESLSEALIPHKWYDPFPKVKYSERPDVAASYLLEGQIVLLLDNSPSCLILPISFFDFFDEAQDYYSLPLIGTYLKLIRIAVFFVTLLLTPTWYVLLQYMDSLPDYLQFLAIEDDLHIPVFIQLLLMEFGIDAIKMASLNTPQSLTSSFSVIGALILGEFAIKAGWFNGEVIFYMAFVALANFTQASYEIGYATKFMRMLLLVLTLLFKLYGFIAGILFLIYLMFLSKSALGRSYMYPLYPLNTKLLKRVFIREKLKNKDC